MQTLGYYRSIYPWPGAKSWGHNPKGFPESCGRAGIFSVQTQRLRARRTPLPTVQNDYPPSANRSTIGFLLLGLPVIAWTSDLGVVILLNSLIEKNLTLP